MPSRRGLRRPPLLPGLLLAAACAAPPAPRILEGEDLPGQLPPATGRPWPGLQAAPAGDVDDDGRSDILVLAAFRRDEAPDRAALRLYSGHHGRLLWERPVDLPHPGSPTGGLFLLADPSRPASGRPATILLASWEGPEALVLHLLDPADGRTQATARVTRVPPGAVLELAGDLDGDRRLELLLTAAGRSRLLRQDGSPFPWPKGDLDRSEVSWIRPPLHPAGDLDQDGFPDLLQFAGEAGAPPPSSWSSPARALSGRSGAVLAWLWEPLWYTFLVAARGTGDGDGDGIPDLAWLVRADQPGGALRLQLYGGPDGNRLLWERNWEGMPLRPGQLAWTGDMDGDGRDDLALTLHGGWTGTVVVALSGTDGTLLAHHTQSAGRLSPLETAQRHLQGRLHPGFAAVLAPAGDTDGDGQADLLVGTTAGPGRPLAHVRLYSGADGRILRVLGGGPLAGALEPTGQPVAARAGD